MGEDGLADITIRQMSSLLQHSQRWKCRHYCNIRNDANVVITITFATMQKASSLIISHQATSYYLTVFTRVGWFWNLNNTLLSIYCRICGTLLWSTNPVWALFSWFSFLQMPVKSAKVAYNSDTTIITNMLCKGTLSENKGDLQIKKNLIFTCKWHCKKQTYCTLYNIRRPRYTELYKVKK